LLSLTDRTKGEQKDHHPEHNKDVPFQVCSLSTAQAERKQGKCVPARWKANAILIVLATMSLRNMAVAEKDYRFEIMRLSSSCKLKSAAA
jgi:hypothetical protein